MAHGPVADCGREPERWQDLPYESRNCLPSTGIALPVLSAIEGDDANCCRLAISSLQSKYLTGFSAEFLGLCQGTR